MSCCQACGKSQLAARLCSDHRNFLETLAQLRMKSDPRDSQLEALVKASNLHHQEEESHIVPLLIQKGHKGIASKLLIDHAVLRTLKAELLSATTAAEARTRLRSLQRALITHIQFETSIAFPKAV